MVLDDPSVSRRHARLLVGNEVVVTDVGSTNGTAIDGVPVFRPQVKSGAGACAERLPAFDAVVVSSDAHEATLHARASTLFERKHIPVIEIYGRALSGLKLGE